MSKDTGLRETWQCPGLQHCPLAGKDYLRHCVMEVRHAGQTSPCLFSRCLIYCCSPPYLMQIMLCNNLYIYDCVWPELPVSIHVSPLPEVSEHSRLDQAWGLTTQAGQVSGEKCTVSCIFNLRFSPSLIESGLTPDRGAITSSCCNDANCGNSLYPNVGCGLT